MKFPKETLKELVDGFPFTDENGEEYKIIHQEQTGSRRWVSEHELVFSYKGKLYITYYEQGLTECQDTSPYEYAEDEIDCEEVEAYEQTITRYRIVK